MSYQAKIAKNDFLKNIWHSLQDMAFLDIKRAS